MLAPGIVLLAAGILIGLLPGGPVAAAADAFADRDAYAALVLDGRLDGRTAHSPPADPWTLPGLAGFAATLLLAAAIAAASVHRPAGRAVSAARRRRPARLLGRAACAAAARLHALHSGHIGDYAAWLTAGVAVLALLTTRF
ncbi:hypothetical protein [Actinomadura sp. 9N215]|uniref:hypothetical protein n=1 Tax=Actinomadura sp. 9N215 TaxID=3375150 RepID=UPI003792B790